MNQRQEFHGPNIGVVEELLQRFRQNPQSVDAETRRLLEGLELPGEQGEAPALLAAPLDLRAAVGVADLAQSIRFYGYLQAQLDPLGEPPPGDASLELGFHGLSAGDLQRLPASLVAGPVAQGAANAAQALQALRQVYCGALGYDYAHIRHPEERRWLRDAAESGRFRLPLNAENAGPILERLTQVEVFEQFLHRTFPGRTRFSIEGVDMLVPMLDELVAAAADEKICMIFLGMAHRGRLNVLAHILGKPYAQILAEFHDRRSRFSTWDALGWTGDVKYHRGGERAVGQDAEEVRLVVYMPPNPSHLEHINPVLMGMARAAGTRSDRPGPGEFFPKASLPVLIHGDAAFTGEGVVAETLNLARLEGYQVAGTVHIITDNQLGFTTQKEELRSSLHASDLAKGFEIPILHVNADDPLACLEAVRIAFGYRLRFQKDVVIDLIGYRRFGHNEGDEPSFTQPLMYRNIAGHPTVRALWAERGAAHQVLAPDMADQLVTRAMERLEEVNAGLKESAALLEPYPKTPPPGAAKKVDTAVPLEKLRQTNQALLAIPADFHLNSKLERALRRRRQALDDPQAATVDWATAETLALGTILAQGTAVRLTGEDVIRGTFSQRHAVFYDVEQEGKTYTPLQSFPQARAAFEIYNSPLTENALLGFEYGYNLQAPGRLVLWEAQYGDFINVAQIMVDEFLVSARAKWGQAPSLVLLLPHGNEGQGPDHSSARMERFLQLAATHNLRLACPGTAGQYFHLLRRQAALLQTDPLPLVVFTPKGLLRHALAASAPRSLAEERWQPVVEMEQPGVKPKAVRRLLLCCGRIFTDLLDSPHWKAAKNLALLRFDQLYPFPAEPLEALLERYTAVEEVDWIQEEPHNMGAWEYIRPHLAASLAGRCPLRYIGRPASPSPAEGSSAWYAATQQALVEAAFQQEHNLDLVESEAVPEEG